MLGFIWWWSLCLCGYLVQQVLQLLVWIILLQQLQLLWFFQWQQFGELLVYLCGLVELFWVYWGECCVCLFDDMFQYGGQQCVFGVQFVIVIGWILLYVGQYQVIVMYVCVQYMEVVLVVQVQYQYVIGIDVEIFDVCFYVVGCWQGWVIDFVVVQDQVYVKGGILLVVFVQYVQVVVFEYLQVECGVGQQYGVQGKQWQGCSFGYGCYDVCNCVRKWCGVLLKLLLDMNIMWLFGVII